MKTFNILICYLLVSLLTVAISKIFCNQRNAKFFDAIVVAFVICVSVPLCELQKKSLPYWSCTEIIVVLISGSLIGNIFIRRSDIVNPREFKIVNILNGILGFCAVFMSVQAYYILVEAKSERTESFIQYMQFFNYVIFQYLLLLITLVLGCIIFASNLIVNFKIRDKFKPTGLSNRDCTINIIILAIILSLCWFLLWSLFQIYASMIFYGILFLGLVFGVKIALPTQEKGISSLIYLLSAMTGILITVEGLLFNDWVLSFGGVIISLISSTMIGLTYSQTSRPSPL